MSWFFFKNLSLVCFSVPVLTLSLISLSLSSTYDNAPIGIRCNKMSGHQWNKATSISWDGHPGNFLYHRDFVRYNDLNACLATEGIGNMHYSMTNYDLEDPDGLHLSLFANNYPAHGSIPGLDPDAYQSWWNHYDEDNFSYQVGYTSVILAFSRNEVTLSDTAFKYLDKITDFYQDEYYNNPAFRGYQIEIENHQYDNEQLGTKYEELDDADMVHQITWDCFEHAINKIRQRDKTRPIATYICYWCGKYNTNPGYEDYFDKLFTDEQFMGWNILQNFNYIFDAGLDMHEVEWYAGHPYNSVTTRGEAAYFRHTWNRMHLPRRSLSLDVERYIEFCNANGGIDGPRPEWWEEIALMREWHGVDTDEDGVLDSYRLGYRRPTYHEYRMQAYSAIAAGARGILAYHYGSGNTSDYGPDHIVDNTISDIEDPDPIPDLSLGDRSGLDDMDPPPDDDPPPNRVASYKYVAEGLVSNVWTDNNDGDLDSDNFEKFRAPLSINSQDLGYAVPDIEPLSTGGSYLEDYHISMLSPYPYDRIQKLFGDDCLGSLLPLTRKLRWWYMSSCSDITTRDVHKYYDNDSYQPHADSVVSLQEELTKARQLPDFDQAIVLADRFKILQVQLEPDYYHNYAFPGSPIGDPESIEFLYYCPIIVGMFDDPYMGDDYDYYLFVNILPWKENGGNIVDADPIDYDVWFERDASFNSSLSVEWSDPNSMNTTLIGQLIQDDFEQEGELILRNRQTIRIEAGDAILVRYGRTQDTTSAVNYNIPGQQVTVEGPRHYVGDVTVSNGAQLTLDGTFKFYADIIVEDPSSKLIITPGSCLRFSDGHQITISNGGALDAQGTPTNRIKFSHVERYPEEQEKWDGIVFYNPSTYTDQHIAYADIRDAYYGVAVHTVNNKKVDLTSLNINNCTTAIYANKAYVVEIKNSTITNSETGIVALNNGVTSYVQIRGCRIENIEKQAVSFSGLTGGCVTGCTIYNAGMEAIKATNVASLSVNGGDDAPNYPYRNDIRYNGYAEEFIQKRTVSFHGTYVSRFNNTSIVENAGRGLYLEYNSNIPNNSWNNYVIIANNTGGMESGMYGEEKTEIQVMDGCDIRLSHTNTSLFHDQWVQLNNLFWYDTDSPYLNYVEDIWWKHWTDPTVVLDALNQYDPSRALHNEGSGEVISFVGTPLDEAPCSTALYWALTEDDQDTLFTGHFLARDVIMDSLSTVEDIIQATEDCIELVQLGYVPALESAVLGRKLCDYTLEEIVYEVQNIQIDSLYCSNEMDRQMDFLSARLHQSIADFDNAIEDFTAIAETSPEFDDSIRALIQIQECIIMQAVMDDGEGLHVQSQGSSPRRVIGLAEERMNDLEMQLLSYRTGRRLGLNELPTEFALEAAYPNPFNPSVTIPYALPQTSNVKITVHNILGQQVAKLVNSHITAGFHRVVWDGHSSTGLPVSSGVYFVTMEAGNYIKTQKIVMMK